MIYQDFVSKYKSITKGEIFKFDNQQIYNYLNKEFENELTYNSKFFIWHIKFKLGEFRISSNSTKNQIWECEIEKILAGD